MTAGKAPFWAFALLVGALALCACEVSGEAGETDEDNDPSSEEEDPPKKDAGKSGDAGKADAGKKDAGRDASSSSSLRDGGRTVIDARVTTGDNPGDDDGDDDDGDDDEGPSTVEPSGDGSTTPIAKDGGSGGPSSGGGEVITTDMGEKIYLDPSCANLMPMIAGRSLDLVGCCLQATKKCGLSTHKLMIPAQFAAMFPNKCRGYEELAMLMVEAPEEKACSVGP